MDHEEGWSELPNDLLEKIVDVLILSSDYIRLRRVCSSWRSTLPEVPKPQFPWLLLPYDHNITHTSNNNNNNNSSSMRSFLNLSNNRVYEVELPGIHEDMLYRGSSMGWLITVERQGPTIRLLNPITAVEFQLPPLTAFPDVLGYRPNMVDEEYVFRECGGTIRTDSLVQLRDFFLQKVVLSSSASPATTDACSLLDHHHDNSNNNYYMAIATCCEDSKLVVCKRGDDRWTTVETKRNCYEDMIFYRGKFYAVNQWGRLSVILMEDNDHPHPREKVVVPSPENGSVFHCLYLAEDSSTGDLYMISRDLSCPPSEGCNSEEEYFDEDEFEFDEEFYYRTVGFEVYKLDRSKGKKGRYIGKWCKIDSLGHDNMLFLGRNTSLCLSSKNFPGFRGNCIYFTDDFLNAHKQGVQGGTDLGVFSLEDGSVEPLPGYEGHPKLIWPPPIWFTPSCF